MRAVGCMMLVLVGMATVANADPATSRIPVQLTWDQKIPMRDGVQLSATIYRDPAQAKRVPAIVVLTPYIAEEVAPQGAYFAQHGYAFVAVDLRGRGNSGGAFIPGQSEGKDGFDAVEWIARQPWCDGQVATWGGSWRGFAQWSLAKELPPHLKTMVPTAAVHLGVDFPQPGGVYSSYVLQWLSFVNGHASNKSVFESDAIWTNAMWQLATTGRAFADLEQITGIRNTVFRTWLAHPREDAFWQALAPSPAQYARLRIPILTITGHFDDDQLGALTYYERHMAHGAPDVTRQHLLVIGPWDHGGTRHPVAELGGLSFGADAVVDVLDLHRAWYDHVLKGAALPALLSDRIACFLMGRNTWIHAASLAQLEGPALTFALDATDARPGDVLHGGALVDQPAALAAVTVVSDPRALPSRDLIEADAPAYLKDQRFDYDGQPSHVSWHSAPLPAELVVAGRPRIKLRVAIDQPDADLGVVLSELLPDGTAVMLSAAILRLRYRKGGVQPVMMAPGVPELVEIPGMRFFARALAKGSRLRLTVDVSARVGLQANTNTGGDLANEPLVRARVAKVTILTGGARGSVIELPRPEPAILQALGTGKR
ncbi:MAG TPA: CocE/NonD family hydrolase [Kofleriaceae bacterium]